MKQASSDPDFAINPFIVSSFFSVKTCDSLAMELT